MSDEVPVDPVESEPDPEPEQPVSGRVLLVELFGGRKLRITIPEGSRVTFGPLVPASGGPKTSRGWAAPSESNSGGTALRIYRGANKEDQITVFRDVLSFRDESLKVEEEVIDSKAEDEVIIDTKGAEARSLRKKTKKWINV